MTILPLVAAMPTPPAVAGLDRVPIAVADLEAAGAGYRRLGFVLNPAGRRSAARGSR